MGSCALLSMRPSLTPSPVPIKVAVPELSAVERTGVEMNRASRVGRGRGDVLDDIPDPSWLHVKSKINPSRLEGRWALAEQKIQRIICILTDPLSA
jgi:hypothetical protein